MDTIETFEFDKLEIDHGEFIEYHNEGRKEKLHVNYLKYKGDKPLVKLNGNLTSLLYENARNENEPTGVTNFLIKLKDRLTEIFQPTIKSYSPQLESYLGDGYPPRGGGGGGTSVCRHTGTCRLSGSTF